MNPLFLALLNAAAPSAALVAAVWFALRFVRLNAATRGAAWWTVIAILIALPALPRFSFVEERPAAMIELQPVERSFAEVSAPSLELPVTPPVENFSWSDALVVLYFAVLAGCLLRIAVDYSRIRALVRTSAPAGVDPAEVCAALGVRRRIRVLASGSLETPLAVGFLRPTVLLPSQLLDRLSAEQIQHVLIHEIAHLARRDDWANLFGKLLQAVCWPHPFIQFALRRIEAEREHACDDWVVHTAGRGSANSYARSLARLVELALARRQHVLAATVVGQGPKVSQRVEALLDRTRTFAPRVSFVKLGWSVVCLGILVAICTQAPDLVAHARTAEPYLNEFQEQQRPAAVVAETPEAQVAPASAAAPAPAPVPVPQAAPAPARAPAEPPVAASGKPGFLAALTEAGYKDLSVDEIIDMRTHGITGDYIREMSNIGWGKLTPKQLVQLRDHGVSAQYLRDLRAAGIRDLTLEQAVELRDHGVNAKMIAEVHGLGFGPYDRREILEMAAHGLRPGFFQGLKERGITKLSARDAIEAATYGLTPRAIDEARKYGPNLTFEQILKLKRAGVI